MEHDVSPLITGIIAVAFASVHLLSPRLVFLDRRPRSIWLSLAGGISVSYVFVHILPELSALQSVAGESAPLPVALYVFALAGLLTFYGLEQMAKAQGGGRTGTSPAQAFWLHLGAFALYNLLIGYLLEEQAREEGLDGLLLYALALGLHYIVNDRALYAHHGEVYLRRGRWILSAAALAGWAIGLAVEIPESWLAYPFAVLAGSVILNVIKEELPEERESRFWAFAAGAVGYAALLLAI